MGMSFPGAPNVPALSPGQSRSRAKVPAALMCDAWTCARPGSHGTRRHTAPDPPDEGGTIASVVELGRVLLAHALHQVVVDPELSVLLRQDVGEAIERR